MINEVLDQLVYLKLKSAHSHLKELHWSVKPKVDTFYIV